MSAAKKIAVIIPVFNITQFLEAALHSVIKQPYSNVEVIVVDDGSDSEKKEEIKTIVKSFPQVILHHLERNRGQAYAREWGTQQSNAEYVIYLDADDVMADESLAFFAEHLAQNADADACYGQVDAIDNAGKIFPDSIKPPSPMLFSGPKVLEALLEGVHLIRTGGAICIRRAAWAKINPANHHLQIGEDWVLWCHLALKGNIQAAGERVVVHKRSHSGNISSRYIDNWDAISDSMKAVYENPEFIKTLGKERMTKLHLDAQNSMHSYFAKKLARQGRRDEAAFHFKRIDPTRKLKIWLDNR